jgi:hypothetical protein
MSTSDIAPQCDSGDAPQLYFVCALIDLADFAVTPDRFESFRLPTTWPPRWPASIT